MPAVLGRDDAYPAHEHVSSAVLHRTPKLQIWGCRGHSFLSLNKELLDSYAACATSQEVVAVQQQWLEHLRDSHAQAQAAAAKGEALSDPGPCDALRGRCFSRRSTWLMLWREGDMDF